MNLEQINEPAWEGFIGGQWQKDIDTAVFVRLNYTPYEGDSKFLAPATEATKKLWDIVCDLSKKEREAGGVLNADTKIVSTLTSHGAGYLDKDLEKIVGVQTDEPFKRSLQPFGGIRMSEGALEMYGYQMIGEINRRSDNVFRMLDEGKGFQSQVIHLYQATGLDNIHGKLNCCLSRATVLVHRGPVRNFRFTD